MQTNRILGDQNYNQMKKKKICVISDIYLAIRVRFLCARHASLQLTRPFWHYALTNITLFCFDDLSF